MVTDVLKKGMAESAPAGPAQLHQLPRIPDRQHPEQHRVDQAEDRGVGADTKGQRDHGDDGKAGAPPEHTEPVSQVSPQIVNDAESARIPTFFLDQLDASEGTQSRVARLLRRHARLDVVLDLSFDMEAQLLGHFVFETRFAEESPQACSQFRKVEHMESSYSQRKADMGSIFMARRAGMKLRQSAGAGS